MELKRRDFLAGLALVALGSILYPFRFSAAECSGPAKQAVLVNFHRGGGKSRPENTLETFLWAWNLDAIPECDVQFTRDGIPVTFHDNNLARLAWGIPEEMKKKGIRDLDWAQVRTLDVGRYLGEAFSPQRIPTLESAFAVMRGFPTRLLYLDEKGLTQGDLETIARLAARHEVARQVFLTTPKYEMARRWKALLPESKTMVWLGSCDEPAVSNRFEELRAAKYEGIDHLNVHIRTDWSKADPFSPSSEFLRRIAAELKARGISFQVISWTEGDKRDTYRRLMELGIEAFSTDYPEVCLEAVRRIR